MLLTHTFHTNNQQTGSLVEFFASSKVSRIKAQTQIKSKQVNVENKFESNYKFPRKVLVNTNKCFYFVHSKESANKTTVFCY